MNYNTIYKMHIFIFIMNVFLLQLLLCFFLLEIIIKNKIFVFIIIIITYFTYILYF